MFNQFQLHTQYTVNKTTSQQKTQKFEIKAEEALKNYMLDYIKQIQDLRTSIKKIWMTKQ